MHMIRLMSACLLLTADAQQALRDVDDLQPRVSMKEVIKPKDFPTPIGPYSYAVKAQGMVYTSGQIAPKEKSIEDQTKKVLENLKVVIEAAGSSMDKVIKTTIFIKNMDDYSNVNDIYATFFPGQTPPARSTVEVARLPKDVLIEVEAIAIS